MGFGWALFTTSTSRSHLPQGATHLPATVRPRRSSRPRRFAPRPVLRVCFTPQPRTGFPPLRGLSLARSRAGFRRPLPPCYCAWHLCGCPLQSASHQLRGLAPRASAVTGDDVLVRPRFRAPLGLLLLRVFTLCAVAAFAASARDLARIEPAACGPRRLADSEPGWPGIRLPTRSRFPT